MPLNAPMKRFATSSTSAKPKWEINAMLTGAFIVVVGLVIGLSGAFSFRFGQMMGGWIIAGIGAVIFLSQMVSLP